MRSLLLAVFIVLIAQVTVAAPIQPDIHQAMLRAWAQSDYGQTSREAGFVLDGDAQHYAIWITPPDNRDGALELKLYPQTFAVFHVHPDASLPTASDADKKVANRYHVKMYTMSRSGVWLYDPATKKTAKIAGEDWLK